ncbi:MAG: sulfatase-like hydrolase/transferase [Acidobacteriota bacterium]|nr:sulfatase-like hydrolase/transferase [Acidobacteriota bacterium]
MTLVAASRDFSIVLIAVSALAAAACSSAEPPPASSARAEHVVLITIDTLRADRVGAYGHARASTPALDGLARGGIRFDRAFATAPITQTSHASLLTGRYPAGHGARHNGIRVDPSVATIADSFRAAGFATGAFVAAFPLDERFGLARGFDVYGDAMPAGANGRVLNERPGRLVVDEAIQWLATTGARRVFLWVHLFEPHAPYGDPADPRLAGMPAADRYDRDVAEADRQVARLLAALGGRRGRTLVVATADHGEAFGEHGEIGHSIFTYDTTLRVPLVMQGPGIAPAIVSGGDVSLIDVAPTLAARAGLAAFDADGRDLSPAIGGGDVPARALYAESFAPRLDFGWSPLRSIRQGDWKFIDAPRAELYNLKEDGGELRNRAAAEPARAAELAAAITRIGGPADTGASASGRGVPDRLAALGYVARSPGGSRATSGEADPKDKVAVASAIARVTSGEARGPALEQALRAVLAEDPGNPQMNLRLGYVLSESGRCRDARPRFAAAIRAAMPTADAHLGLASCQAAAREFDAALRTLREADRVEPGNPVVTANIGLVLADAGRPADAIDPLRRALAASPDLHQARFALALAYASTGRVQDAGAAARELLQRLPAGAPQRPEIERFLRAISSQR